jgi:hypothetical protein
VHNISIKDVPLAERARNSAARSSFTAEPAKETMTSSQAEQHLRHENHALRLAANKYKLALKQAKK